MLVLAIIFVSLYGTLQSRLFAETADRLQATAVLGAAGIDTENLSHLVAKLKEDVSPAEALAIESSSEYREVYNYLNKIRSTNSSLIIYAYILYPGEVAGTARFVVDADVIRLREEVARTGSTGESISGFDVLYDIHDQIQTVKAITQQIPQVGDHFIEDPEFHTSSLMGFAPIFDRKSGVYLGCLGIDISNVNYAAFLSSVFFIAFVVAAALLLLIMAGSFFLAWKISSPIISLSDAVRRFGDSNLDSRSDLNTSIKELYDLKNNFNGMADKIQDYQEHLLSLNQSMERFVPEAFLTFLSKTSIMDVQLGDQIQKDMTIMFSDIRGFTAISEQLTPKQTFNFLNDYLSRIAPVIRRHGGFIDKYLGDGIMAIFPGRVDDAVYAALEMIQEVRRINIQREKDGLTLIDIGTGIHCGTMMMGTIGEAKRMQTTVIADSVNLASRLETMTKEVGARLLVSRSVYNYMEDSDAFMTRYIGSTHFRGKEEQIGVFEVFDQDTASSRQAKSASRKKFEAAVAMLSEGKYAEAEAAFGLVVADNGDDKTALWQLERAKAHRSAAIGE
jgi:class 3 adenylate cyclase